MGGSGSGRWHAGNTRRTTESALSLDIAWVFRTCIMLPDRARVQCGTLTWSRDGTVISEVNYCYRAPRDLTLAYRCNGVEVSETLALTTTAPHFGGVRYWVLCPHCTRRVRKLHMSGQRFVCRRCADLTYTSCQQSHTEDHFAAMLGGDKEAWRYIFKHPENRRRAEARIKAIADRNARRRVRRWYIYGIGKPPKHPVL